MQSGLLGEVCGRKAEEERTADSNFLNVIIVCIEVNESLLSDSAMDQDYLIIFLWFSITSLSIAWCSLLLWGSRWWCDPSQASQWLWLILVLGSAGPGTDGGGCAGVSVSGILFSEHRIEFLLSWRLALRRAEHWTPALRLLSENKLLQMLFSKRLPCFANATCTLLLFCACSDTYWAQGGVLILLWSLYPLGLYT